VPAELQTPAAAAAPAEAAGRLEALAGRLAELKLNRSGSASASTSASAGSPALPTVDRECDEEALDAELYAREGAPHLHRRRSRRVL
jgi:hypothetical protein